MAKVFKCESCSTRYTTTGNKVPPAINWDDGHKCVLVEVKSELNDSNKNNPGYSNFFYKEEDEKRMNIIGQNGNDGLHYDDDTNQLEFDFDADVQVVEFGQNRELDLSKQTIVKFGTKWCGPCIALDGFLDGVIEQGFSRVVRIDVDKEMGLMEDFNIRSVPTTIVFENNNVKHRFTGVKNTSEILKLLS